PEPWGRKAQLLYKMDKGEEGEKALDKAFGLNADYAFGHLLRGIMRQQEGELAGALKLFRRAAELYHPEARELLGEVYSLIAECELYLHRPVAARAALKIAIHNMPASEQLRAALERFFGEASRLPKLARQEYTLLAPRMSDGQ